MKSITIAGGVTVFISGAESRFLRRFDDDTLQVSATDLDANDNELARQLVGRGILRRFHNTNTGIYYSINGL